MEEPEPPDSDAAPDGDDAREDEPSRDRTTGGRFALGNNLGARFGRDVDPRAAAAIAGRVKRRGSMADTLARILDETVASDPQQRTVRELCVRALCSAAMRGNMRAQQLLWERSDGKVPLPIRIGPQVEDESGTDLVVQVIDSPPAEQLAAMLQAIEVSALVVPGNGGTNGTPKNGGE